MRSEPSYGDRNQPIEKLKEKWAEFTDGLFVAIRQEEMRIRREELQKHTGAHSQHSAPARSASKRGGEDV